MPAWAIPRLVVKKPPLPKPPRKAGARWVEPTELVEVVYPNKRADGRLRHPAFKGLRDGIAKKQGRVPRRGVADG